MNNALVGNAQKMVAAGMMSGGMIGTGSCMNKQANKNTFGYAEAKAIVSNYVMKPGYVNNPVSEREEKELLIQHVRDNLKSMYDREEQYKDAVESKQLDLRKLELEIRNINRELKRSEENLEYHRREISSIEETLQQAVEEVEKEKGT